MLWISLCVLKERKLKSVMMEHVVVDLLLAKTRGIVASLRAVFFWHRHAVVAVRLI